jgi:hypothetical protein
MDDCLCARPSSIPRLTWSARNACLRTIPKGRIIEAKKPPSSYNQSPTFTGSVESFCDHKASESKLHHDHCQARDQGQ